MTDTDHYDELRKMQRAASAAATTTVTASVQGDFRLAPSSLPGLVYVTGHYPFVSDHGPLLVSLSYMPESTDAPARLRADAAVLLAEADRIERDQAGKAL